MAVGGFMKRRIVLVTLSNVLALAACERLRPPADAQSQASAEAGVSTSAGWASRLGAQAVTDEARRIADYPGLVSRDGNRLTVYYDGKSVFTRTSDPEHCRGDATCDVWQFDSGIVLRDPATGKLETYAQLYHSLGEGGHTVIVTRDGKEFDLYSPGVASPDGRWIAFGDDWVDEYVDGNVLGVTDWTGETPNALFEPSCMPVAWQGNDRFSVKCAVSGKEAYHNFAGDVVRSGKAWRLIVGKIAADTPYGDDASASSATTADPLPKTYESRPEPSQPVA